MGLLFFLNFLLPLDSGMVVDVFNCCERFSLMLFLPFYFHPYCNHFGPQPWRASAVFFLSYRLLLFH